MVYSTVSKYLKALVLVLGSALVIGCGGGGGGGEDGGASAPPSKTAGDSLLQSSAIVENPPQNSAGGETSSQNSTSDNRSSGQTTIVAPREISLGWDIPTEREDDTALELYEIDGYVIAYGDAPDSLETTYTVTGGQVTSHTFNNVDQGTYYFAIATVDSDGSQGLYSDPVQVVVN